MDLLQKNLKKIKDEKAAAIEAASQANAKAQADKTASAKEIIEDGKKT